MIFLLFSFLLSTESFAQGGGGSTGTIIHAKGDCLNTESPMGLPSQSSYPLPSQTSTLPKVSVNSNGVRITLPRDMMPAPFKLGSDEEVEPTKQEFSRPTLGLGEPLDAKTSFDRIQTIIKNIPKVESVTYTPSDIQPFIDVKSSEEPKVVFDRLLNARVICN
jgi:hypothetical protein